MDFKNISDQELLIVIKGKALEERKLTLEVLNLLREVEVRRLHLERGFSSLHHYCVEELKYSDGSAQRRIQSMRLLSEVPEVRKSLEMGALSLSNMAQVQCFFNAQARGSYSIEQKREILKSVEGQSRREAEKTLLSLNPEVRVPTIEKVKAVSATQTKIEVTFDNAFMIKVEKLKSLLSHKNPNFTFRELVELLVNGALKKLDSAKEKREGVKKNKEATPPAESNRVTSKVSRFIPSRIKREVWCRDQGQCQYEDPLTKRKCLSTHRLEYDHQIPFSLGGTTETKNMKLLCKNHNLHKAIKEFGSTHMMSFLN